MFTLLLKPQFRSRTLSFGRLRQRIVLKSVPYVEQDYFSSFNQSDYYFLASWSLLKRPILCQTLRVLFLLWEYCFALLTVNSLGRRYERKDLVKLFSVGIVSHITYASSVCYKSAFNKLKLHVIELDKVKALIYRSFLWTFLLEIGVDMR